MSKKELRKWSATGPNDSILCPPLEKLHSLRTADIRNNPVVEKDIPVIVAAVIENEYFGYHINKMAEITTTYNNNNWNKDNINTTTTTTIINNK